MTAVLDSACLRARCEFTTEPVAFAAPFSLRATSLGGLNRDYQAIPSEKLFNSRDLYSNKHACALYVHLLIACRYTRILGRGSRHHHAGQSGLDVRAAASSCSSVADCLSTGRRVRRRLLGRLLGRRQVVAVDQRLPVRDRLQQRGTARRAASAEHDKLVRRGIAAEILPDDKAGLVLLLLMWVLAVPESVRSAALAGSARARDAPKQTGRTRRCRVEHGRALY